MSLDRITSGFQRNHAQAQRSAKAQLEIILGNIQHLLTVKNGERMAEAARKFKAEIDASEKLSENKLSYVDAIYEATMKGMGFESVNTHHDKRSGLRHPR